MKTFISTVIALAILQLNVNFQCKCVPVNITETANETIGSDQGKSEIKSTVVRSIDEVIGEILDQNQTKHNEENNRNSATEQSASNDILLEETTRIAVDAVHRCPIDQQYVDGECRYIIIQFGN